MKTNTIFVNPIHIFDHENYNEMIKITSRRKIFIVEIKNEIDYNNNLFY